MEEIPLQIAAMDVPTLGRDAVHHATRSASKKGTMPTSATRGMHEEEMLSATQPILCSLNGPEPSDWYLDTGASTHMTLDLSHLDQASNYTCKDQVIVGNGASLPITHTGKISPTPNLHLLDVLVILCHTKNILSISKLTYDFPFSSTFTNNFFTVQNCQMGRVVATNKRDGGLFVLEHKNSTVVSVLKNKVLYALYDL